MKDLQPIPAAKIQMMKASLRCLVLGMLGLLPIIGVPFALAGMWASFSARKRERQFWNPAKPQRVLGFVCAVVGLLIWGAADTILIYHALDGFFNA